jgi:hypothetical protein
MAKPPILNNPAFNKHQGDQKANFHLAPQANPFNAIFETPTLDEKTANAIDRLMVELATPEKTEEEISQDAMQLKNLSVEVKAIEKQGVLLIGERLFKAREIFGKYEKGHESFSSWLNLVFKHRSSAYNFLSYYELYKALPNHDLRARLKEMPHKAAYVLAARKGDISKKTEVIEKYSQLRADEILSILQDVFPPAMRKEDKRSSASILIKVIRLKNSSPKNGISKMMILLPSKNVRAS